MKKYKVKPYQSYYHYKRQKMMSKRIICAVVLLGLVFAVLIRTHKIELQDMNKLFNSSKVAVLEESTPVYLEQDSVQYDVHMTPTSVKGVTCHLYVTVRYINWTCKRDRS